MNEMLSTCFQDNNIPNSRNFTRKLSLPHIEKPIKDKMDYLT